MNRKKIAILLLCIFAVICVTALVSCATDGGNGNNNNGGNGNNDTVNNGGNNDSNNGGNSDVNNGDQNGNNGNGDNPNGDNPNGDNNDDPDDPNGDDGPLVDGVDAVLSEDGKTVQYGYYPQTHVSDSALIATLNALTPLETNGWYLYDGAYYAKETAKVYNGVSYTFDDGTAIVDGEEYWFKCEPIAWQVLSADNGTYQLLSCKLLDVHNYYADYSSRAIDGSIVYANNYEKSGIREWLNGSFYNTAFAFNNANIIQGTVVNNGASTTDAADNSYACANTTDNVYLPSYQDYLNSDYGFDSNAADTSQTRECVTTDYARAQGAWCNTQDSLKYNGTYWTRSPASAYYYCAWNVNSGGFLSAYAVDGDSHCVRPCITIVSVSLSK